MLIENQHFINFIVVCESSAGPNECSAGSRQSSAGPCEHSADSRQSSADPGEHSAGSYQSSDGPCEHSAGSRQSSAGPCERSAGPFQTFAGSRQTFAGESLSFTELWSNHFRKGCFIKAKGQETRKPNEPIQSFRKFTILFSVAGCIWMINRQYWNRNLKFLS